jgi:ABC-type nickel/cobalt efflux system permease component RcnA
MMQPLLLALAGLSAGGIHVLAGPDHLAAVAPLAADSSRRRWVAGMLWGIGHTSGVVLVAAVAFVARGWFDIGAVSSWSERLVGVALIGVGLWGLQRAVRQRVHAHDDAPSHTHASFAFGVLHGLAGSAHVIGVLPALALPTATDAAIYLGAYGVGNVLAMTLFSSLMGALGAATRRSGFDLHRGFMAACSLAAIAVGGYWLVS